MKYKMQQEVGDTESEGYKDQGAEMVRGPAEPSGNQKKEWGQQQQQPAEIRSCDRGGKLQKTTENSQPQRGLAACQPIDFSNLKRKKEKIWPCASPSIRPEVYIAQ